MAIIRKTDRPNQPARAEWDPFHMMERMLGMDPFRDAYRPSTGFGSDERAFYASFDVRENKDAFVFKADLPGIKESDIDITLNANMLTISGKREAETRDQQDTWYAVERSFGSFARSFTLPEAADVDHIKAELKDGVLTLVLPKKPELQPRKISVSVAKESAKA